MTQLSMGYTTDSIFEQTERSPGLVRGVALAALIGAALMALRQVGWGAQASTIPVRVFLVIALLCYLMTRAGRTALPRAVLPPMLLFIILWSAWISSGVHDLAMVFLPLMLIISGLLMGPRAVLIMAALSSVATGVLVGGEVLGYLQTPFADHTDWGDAVTVAIIQGTSGVLLAWLQRRLARYHARILQQDNHLREQNAALQRQTVEQKVLFGALEESRSRYVRAAEGANDGLWEVELASGKVHFSPRWKAMLGYAEGEIGASQEEWLGRVHDQDRPRLEWELAAHLAGASPHLESEHRLRHKDGSWLWVLARGLVFRDEAGVASRLSGSLTDITARRQAEAQLERAALYDGLTGLASRVLLLDRLEQVMRREQRRGIYAYAVLYLDLDDFKVLNESRGHLVGDQALVTVARRLEAELRAVDTFARLGGDEFVILLTDLKCPDDVGLVLMRIREQLTLPVELGGEHHHLEASIGVVVGGPEYADAGEVLRDADIAMYRAKSLGKNTWEMFRPSMLQEAQERLSLLAALRRAIAQRALQVAFQPVMRLPDEVPVGLEALARWKDARFGQVSPGRFIPLAEEGNLIVSLDLLVLRQACQQLQRWRQRHPDWQHLTVAVNLSARHFMARGNVVADVEQILHETGLPAGNLCLEITESALMADLELVRPQLNRLRKAGIRIEIDDFGVGYSSLRYLRDLPADYLKLDRSFVTEVTTCEKQAGLVEGIVNLARLVSLGVIGEGVETPEQAERLLSLGCQQVQGYLYAQPMEAEKAEAWLEVRLNREPEATAEHCEPDRQGLRYTSSASAGLGPLAAGACATS